jgi:hypothetical protein
MTATADHSFEARRVARLAPQEDGPKLFSNYSNFRASSGSMIGMPSRIG